MTEDNGNKLTLSGKSTLTLKKTNITQKNEGRKIVQVEVRKKRFVQNQSQPTSSVEIDEALAQKLELIAKAKEHDAKRKQEEEEKALLRQKKKEEEEKAKEKAKLEAEKKAAEEAKKTTDKKVSVPSEYTENDNKNHNQKYKDKKDDYDDEDEEDYYNKKNKKNSSSENNKPMTKEETFEQERKKIQKRSFETPKRNNKINVNSYMFNDEDDEDDYGYGAPRRRFKKKQPKPQNQPQAPQEKIIKEVIIPEIITVQDLANRMAEKSSDVIKKLMSYVGG